MAKKITKSQINQIKNIIKDYMQIIMSVTTGDGNPSPQLLRKLGLSKPTRDLISESYKYGKLRIAKDKDLATILNPSDVRKMINKVKLTPAQQSAVTYSQIKAQQYVDNLTQKAIANTISVALQSDIGMWQAVRDIVPGAIENNVSVREVAATLRDYTKDMYRDWNRVAHTEMWSAKCQGEADAILAGESPLSNKKGDTIVYMRPDLAACPSCRRIYLESDKTTPRTFTLTELISHGNNYGRKQADWVACVPPLHPNCHCTINVKPDDTDFDSQGNLVYRKS